MHPLLSAALLLILLAGYMVLLGWLARRWLVPKRRPDGLERLR
jgi:hypothetical protein